MTKIPSLLLGKGAPFSETDIRELLGEYRIPLELWGEDAVRNLLSVLNGSDSSIDEVDSKLTVRAKTVAICVLNNTTSLRLHKLIKIGPLGKKTDHIGRFVRKWERGFTAAGSCITAELGFEQDRIEKNIHFDAHDLRDPLVPQDWPGTLFVEDRQWFKLIIPEDLFKAEGYVRTNGQQENRFVWEKYQ